MFYTLKGGSQLMDKLNFKELALSLPFIIIAGILSIPNPNLVLATQNDSAIDSNYFKKPTPDIYHTWFYRSGGFTLQPVLNSYVSLGKSIKLTTTSRRSSLSLLEYPLKFPSHQWYRNENNSGWTKFNGQTSKTLTFKPNKIGTIFYQLKDTYRILDKTDTFYSKVAAVHTTLKETNASDLKIFSINNYLYNINSPLITNNTNMIGSPIPYYSTGTLSWSIDRPDLASINDYGEVQANIDGRSGIVHITGKIKNPDGSTIYSDPKEITVGGGLDDQTVHVGNKAIFSIRSSYEQARDQPNTPIRIKWFKKNSAKKITKLKTQDDPFVFQTDNTQEQDNGDKYYATISTTSVSNKPIQTNDAKLTVISANTSGVTLQSSITDLTFPDNYNSQTELHNVYNNDKINYKFTLTNNSVNDFHNSNLKYYIPEGTTINNILINDSPLTADDFTVTDNTLTINSHDLKKDESKKIIINTTISGITKKEQVVTTSHFSASDINNKKIEIDGAQLKLNYALYKFSAYFKNIDFEPIKSFENNSLVYRTSETNSPNEMISVDDQRRKKNSLTLYLTQSKQLINNHNLLPADLKFFQPGQDSIGILKKIVPIATSKDGDKFPSIKWNRNEGLLLHLNRGNLIAGNYSGELSWNFIDSVK